MKQIVLAVTCTAALCASALAPLTASAALPMTAEGRALPSLAPMLERVTPAVVEISVAGVQTRQQAMDPFGQFFGIPQGGRQQPFRGLGSGVIIDADKGHVVTNYHVVNNADEIMVTLADGREIKAKLLGKDEQSDIALLAIDADNLTAIPKANSDNLRVGDFVVAIGNPFGLGQTVTSGIISALGRSGLNIENYENFIQTDAAINSGNSGGALVNLNGELVGINTAIIAPGGGNVGIGFAIPVNMVANLLDQLLEFGEVRRGVLGVTGGELTPDLAEAFGHNTKHGAFINQVMPGSSADKAGLKAGDIVVAVDGKAIKSFGELRALIATTGAGRTVKVDVIREGKRRSFDVKLMEGNEQAANAQSIHPRLSGATLSDSDGGGIRVDQVALRSPAAQLGLREGDQIIGANNIRIKSLKELRALLDKKPRVLALNILRDGQSFYLILR